MRPCLDVPEHLWISSFPTRARGGNHGTKIAWTDELVERCRLMRENGDSWPDVVQMLYEQTGVRLTANAARLYLERYQEWI